MGEVVIRAYSDAAGSIQRFRKFHGVMFPTYLPGTGSTDCIALSQALDSSFIPTQRLTPIYTKLGDVPSYQNNAQH